MYSSQYLLKSGHKTKDNNEYAEHLANLSKQILPVRRMRS